MLEYLSVDITCSKKQIAFRERSSRKTLSFEEQIMSKDKYPSIFLHKSTGSNSQCAVPENIRTPTTEGIGISWGVAGGFCKNQKFKERYEA